MQFMLFIIAIKNVFMQIYEKISFIKVRYDIIINDLKSESSEKVYRFELLIIFATTLIGQVTLFSVIRKNKVNSNYH